MTICIAGKNDIAVSVLEFLLQNYPEHQYCVVCAQSDKGINSWQKSLRYTAVNKHIPIKTLEEVYPIEDLLFLSLQFDRIIKPYLFTSAKLYNVHFSLLPAYKGMYASIMPILHNEKQTGVTLHLIDEGIDTGPVIDQMAFDITYTDTAKDVYNHSIESGVAVLKRNIEHLLAGNVVLNQQDYKGACYYSKKALDLSNSAIDLRKTAEEIHNQIRALTFRDYQLPVIGDYPIYRSEIVLAPSVKKEVGTFSKISEHKLLINAVDYQVYAYIDFQKELFEAAEQGNIDLIRHIQDLGYDISVRNNFGWNLLIVAAYNEHVDLAQYLLISGFDVNATNYKGTSVLMYAMTAASKSDKTEMLDLLVSYNVDFQLKDDNDWDVLEYAKKYANPRIIKYIQDHYDKVS